MGLMVGADGRCFDLVLGAWCLGACSCLPCRGAQSGSSRSAAWPSLSVWDGPRSTRQPRDRAASEAAAPVHRMPAYHNAATPQRQRAVGGIAFNGVIKVHRVHRADLGRKAMRRAPTHVHAKKRKKHPVLVDTSASSSWFLSRSFWALYLHPRDCNHRSEPISPRSVFTACPGAC